MWWIKPRGTEARCARPQAVLATTSGRHRVHPSLQTVEDVTKRLHVSPATLSRHVPGDWSGLDESLS
jgi:hypothetical protein